MRILDVHVHYNGNAPELDRCVRLWRDAGVERVVLFGINRDEEGGYTSLAEVAAAARKHPDFIVPFAYLNPGRHNCVREIEQAIDRGFRGAKLIFPARPYDDDEYFPIYERAAGAGMVCLFHTGVVAGNGSEYQRRWRVSSGYMRPIHLDRIARTFPEMSLIGAHIGAGAWYEEACAVMRWNPNVYFDLSIGQLHYRRRDTPEGEDGRAINPRMQALYDTGALNLKKILFGSDAFFGRPPDDVLTGLVAEETSPAYALSTLEFELDAIGATDEEKNAVRWNTAAGILGCE